MEITATSIYHGQSAPSLTKYQTSNNKTHLQLMFGNNREQFAVREESTLAGPEIINPHFADRQWIYHNSGSITAETQCKHRAEP